MKDDNKTPDYGNWVPRKLLYLFGLVAAASAAAAVCVPLMAVKLVFLAGVVLCGTAWVYFYRAHRAFSYRGGGLSGKILDMVLSHLPWDGNGTILDIGCGSGALAIKLAKNYPHAHITGLDYWGAGWDYNKNQCQQNAALEGVPGRIEFVNGTASKLPFEDERFDAVVSNFTFHEVRDAKNKRDVVKEALRVVKKGGLFAFHDLFYQKSLYGDVDEMLTELRTLAIAEIDIITTSTLEIIPNFLRTPSMLGTIGLLYGRK
jgi:SAM-dependent methyltransferase